MIFVLYVIQLHDATVQHARDTVFLLSLSSDYSSDILTEQMFLEEATRPTCSDAVFSPLENDQDLAVVKTHVNIALSLEEAVMRLTDGAGFAEEDDTEGCPVSSCEPSLLGSMSHLHSVSLPGDSSSNAPSTQLSASSSKGEQFSNKAARDKAYRRRKKQQKRERERFKLEHTFPEPKYKITPTLSAKLSKVTHLQVPGNAANLRAAKGAWIGVRGEVGQERNSLEALLAKGYTYKTWDGM